MIALHIGFAVALGLAAWLVTDIFTGAVTAVLVFAATSCFQIAFRDH